MTMCTKANAIYASAFVNGPRVSIFPFSAFFLDMF